MAISKSLRDGSNLGLCMDQTYRHCGVFILSPDVDHSTVCHVGGIREPMELVVELQLVRMVIAARYGVTRDVVEFVYPIPPHCY